MRSEIGSLVLALMMAGTAAEPLSSDAPDAEFLEFLGSFEDEDGVWVDPFELEDMLALSADAETPEETEVDEAAVDETDERDDAEQEVDDEDQA